MSSQNKQKNSIHVGSSLILVTFVLLCLVTFSILALTSAKADYAMTQETGTNTTNYYNATNIAEEKIAFVANTFQETRNNSRNFATFYNKIESTFAKDNAISVSREDENILVEIILPVSNSRSLQVTMTTAYQRDNSTFSFRIDSYKTVAMPLIDDEIVIDNTRFLF